MVSQSVGVLQAHCTLKFSKSDPFDYNTRVCLDAKNISTSQLIVLPWCSHAVGMSDKQKIFQCGGIYANTGNAVKCSEHHAVS